MYSKFPTSELCLQTWETQQAVCMELQTNEKLVQIKRFEQKQIQRFDKKYKPV